MSARLTTLVTMLAMVVALQGCERQFRDYRPIPNGTYYADESTERISVRASALRFVVDVNHEGKKRRHDSTYAY